MTPGRTTESRELVARIYGNKHPPAADIQPFYNFAVCGSGTSGSVVASRLTETGDASVLLLEGGRTDDVPSAREPRLWPTNLKTERSAHILVVDNDATMRHMIASYLEQQGLSVTSASQGQDAARQLAEQEPSLVILDLRLGQEDGLELLRKTRSHSDVPVIIVTGQRCDAINRVVGLGLGADDYIAKPFGLRELLARIRAVLRRREAGRAALQREAKRGRSRFGGWQLDRRARRLTNPDGAPVALTKREYAMLIAFLDAPQRPLSREQLLRATRVHEDVFDRSIDVQVLRLRRKLESDPTAPNVIRTERGVGYVFALAVQPG